jgi:hypothetical protein
MPAWAYLFEHEDAEPATDRLVVQRSGTTSVIVGVPSADAVPAVAAGLVEEFGVSLVELCGGFTTAHVARVVDAVGPGVAVGHVTFPAESLPAAAAYATAATTAV